MDAAEIARGKKKGGDGCSGFCAGAADRPGKWCNSRGDRRWELAWVSWRVGGAPASSPKFKWRKGLEFLYPPKRRRFDVRSIKQCRFDTIKIKN